MPKSTYDVIYTSSNECITPILPTMAHVTSMCHLCTIHPWLRSFVSSVCWVSAKQPTCLMTTWNLTTCDASAYVICVMLLCLSIVLSSCWVETCQHIYNHMVRVVQIPDPSLMSSPTTVLWHHYSRVPVCCQQLDPCAFHVPSMCWKQRVLHMHKIYVVYKFTAISKIFNHILCSIIFMYWQLLYFICFSSLFLEPFLVHSQHKVFLTN
jgi:hypothetical protein